MFLCLFGIDVDSSSAIAGWTGTSMLGGVLGWLLFKHLPAKDAQTEGLAKSHAIAQEKLLDRHDQQMRQAQTVFQEAIESVINHCRDELTTIAAAKRQNET